MQVNEVTEQIIGAAMEVHRALGPGLLESAYEALLEHELAERKLTWACSSTSTSSSCGRGSNGW